MHSINFGSKPIQFLTLAFLSLIWGSSFILMKKGLAAFGPDEVAAFRIFLVFLVLLPHALTHLNLIRKSNAFSLLAVGMLGSAIPYVLFVTAQTEISSSLSGILNALTPLFTLVFGVMFFRRKTRLANIAGVLLGLAGAAGLIYFSEEHNLAHSFTIFMLLPAIASAFYGLNVNIIKSFLQNFDPVAITSLSFFMIGPFAGIYLFGFTDFIPHASSPDALMPLVFISVLAVVGTAFAVIVFNSLIKYTTALYASSVTYLIPVVAIFWGLFDNEKFYWIQALFVVLIFVGISLINRPKTSK